MTTYITEQIPLKFVDSISEGKHVALLYEDSEYARLIEFRFLKNGLDRGQQCLYVTSEDSGIILLKLLTYGIPLEHFKSGRMRVLQLHYFQGDYVAMMSHYKKEMLKVSGYLHGPFWIVGRIVPEIGTISGMSIELEFEREIHKVLEDLDGSIMCTYDIRKLEQTMKRKWLLGIFSTHHDIIYAPEFGKGGVLSCP
jgi:hypothetical protein